MRRNLKSRFTAATLIVAAITLTLTACDPSDPAQRQAFYDLNPEVGAAVTAETMNDAQRTVVTYLQEQQAAFLAAVEANRRLDEQRRAIQLDSFLTCVRRHESDRGPWPHTNGYQAQNPRSSASGAYQFIDSTWRNASARAGHPGYARASHAPWYVQDAVAHHLAYSGGRSAWAGTGCPGT